MSLRYMEGDGIPVVFFHQTPSSSLMYEPIMHELKGMNMFAIDTPGFLVRVLILTTILLLVNIAVG
ncbi:MAG: hypothetical protein Ct9H300mP6_02450 [Gammaproteobacteria bacterium]|nr:MAG: hypothetical protein Ct9H300mP6_02450 [Gammaproteobacteria bacterium]